MIQHHWHVVQRSEEWIELRRGKLTASEIGTLLTKTGKPADNDKVRAIVWELAAQRISGVVEPSYISDDMLRGENDEIDARGIYSRAFAEVTECGFVENDEHDVLIGCSPDGLVGSHGMIEIKSRRQRFHVEHIVTGKVPEEFMPQIQASLLVTGRVWCDFICYCPGLPMIPCRVFPDASWHQAIIEVAQAFEERVALIHGEWMRKTTSADRPARFIETERTIEQEMRL